MTLIESIFLPRTFLDVVENNLPLSDDPRDDDHGHSEIAIVNVKVKEYRYVIDRILHLAIALSLLCYIPTIYRRRTQIIPAHV